MLLVTAFPAAKMNGASSRALEWTGVRHVLLTLDPFFVGSVFRAIRPIREKAFMWAGAL